MSEEDERLLAAADALARSLVDRAAPVRFAAARRAEELGAIFRLRYRTVIDGGWVDPADLPDGLERDRFDDRAVQVGGWQGDELVACARLVFPEPGLLLPTEQEFGVTVEPRGQVVDVGRGIVEPGNRSDDRRVFIGLLAWCWLELRARGFHRMCGDAADWLIAMYRDMGFEVQVIAPARPHWGEERSPFQIDGLASVRSVMSRLAPR